MKKNLTTEGGHGWLRTGKNGSCTAHYLMVARKILGGPTVGTRVSGVLKVEIDAIMLAAMAGGAVLELADGRLFPIEIVRAQAARAVFATASAVPML